MQTVAGLEQTREEKKRKRDEPRRPNSAQEKSKRKKGGSEGGQCVSAPRYKQPEKTGRECTIRTAPDGAAGRVEKGANALPTPIGSPFFISAEQHAPKPMQKAAPVCDLAGALKKEHHALWPLSFFLRQRPRTTTEAVDRVTTKGKKKKKTRYGSLCLSALRASWVPCVWARACVGRAYVFP